MLRCAKKFAKGKILDMGCGSGYLCQAFDPRLYTGADVHPEAIAYCRKHLRGTFIYSDLFTQVPRIRYDTILFNPPYLPSDPKHPDPALDGGKHGNTIILSFLAQVSNRLAPDGSILLLYSSLSKPQAIHDFLAKNLWEWKLLDKTSHFMETLSVVLITKHALRRELERQNIRCIQFAAKGHRGYVYRGMHRKKPVAIKTNKPINKPGRITPTGLVHEAAILSEVTKKSIGPKVFFFHKDYLVMAWIDGTYFPDALKAATPRRCIFLLLSLLKQAYILDTLGIQKEEMHRPIRNVLVSGRRVTLLDFERARRIPHPHNITQYCQFLSSKYLHHILAPKGFVYDPKDFRAAANIYNKGPSLITYEQIAGLVSKPKKTDFI